MQSSHLTFSARVPKSWRAPAPRIAHAASPLCAFFVCGHTVGSDQFDCCRYRELQSDLGRRISRTLATVVGGSLDRYASSGDRSGARDCASVRGHDPAGRDECQRLIAAYAFDSEIKCPESSEGSDGWRGQSFSAKISDVLDGECSSFLRTPPGGLLGTVATNGHAAPPTGPTACAVDEQQLAAEALACPNVAEVFVANQFGHGLRDRQQQRVQRTPDPLACPLQA